MKGIIIDLEVLYFSTFRRPASTSLILSYSVPPFTTVRGLLSNALGFSRDDYSLQDKIKIGIAVKNFGFKNTELAKILKLKPGQYHEPRAYPSAPMFKEYLVNPKYIIYIGGQEEDIKSIYNALILPKRPLYIGQSDDLPDITTSDILDIDETTSDLIHSVIDEVIPDAIIEKVPYRFSESNGKYDVEYKVISIPKEYPVKCDRTLKVNKFGELNIQLF